jgi:hypothetical protein
VPQVFCVRGFVSDSASEFASRFLWRVKLVGSTWVEDWTAGIRISTPSIVHEECK